MRECEGPGAGMAMLARAGQFGHPCCRRPYPTLSPMNRSRRSLCCNGSLVGGVAWVLSGCGTVSNVVGAVMGRPPEVKAPPPPPPPPKVAVIPKRVVELNVQADKRLNVDAADVSAPVVVRVYLLKADVGFQSADFFS